MTLHTEHLVDEATGPDPDLVIGQPGSASEDTSLRVAPRLASEHPPLCMARWRRS